ncbi:AaceriABR148Wp [[Ashbya] aceris (nom. inval.)]|nr:AaceriABR148Wp [[Ashbya] aceris (nom. inval.)]
MFGLRRWIAGSAWRAVGAAGSAGTRVAVLARPAAAGQWRAQTTVTGGSETRTAGAEAGDASEADRQADEWLAALDELEAEFGAAEYLPEVSLASEGQKLDLMEEVARARRAFQPSEEQQAEWERLQQVPLPPRRDEVIEHVTNMLMRDGKKEKARKQLARALYVVFCATRQDPVVVLRRALDELAPLMAVKTFKTGVAKAAVIPVPLNQRQRQRLAWRWIVEGSEKRSSSDFAVRLGEELVAVHSGRSSGFDKRDAMHKTAVAHRAYIKLK